ncbi:hypothetical protein SAMN04488104_104414 [Algoriphagus faecimaris]|uniref:MotA/TolQ/ExbB proton channel family protein n=1 Tax=Algoriphagus faecimaris TaxID=686796 RepID=A0A1G6WGM8_9BACT|nr:hypothetical protein [Algoriphagus faecimaris]SDD64961.1 hypothetical protein SAMN04488104_104414 [Algoriphagus faecimaris]
MESTFQNLELAVIAIIFIWQVNVFLKTTNKIGVLKNTFNPILITRQYLILREDVNQENVKENMLEYNPSEDTSIPEGYLLITLLQSKSDNNIAISISESINSYLLNNYGAAVNFSIIKDMVDREIDVHDDEISNLIPTPLYLGLAATMTGIIFGLIAMPEIDDTQFTNAINSLIDAVKYAMAASLAGLAFTTILSSSIYKSARKIVLESKNRQLSYIQAKLLPALVASQETGIAGLKHSLDLFTRKGTEISEKIRIASLNTADSINTQLKTIEKVENLKMHRVTKANLDLFEKLESSVQVIEAFEKNIKNIQNISERLESFAQKTKSIEDLAQTIKLNIEDSNDQLNQSKLLTEFLTDHFKKLDSHGQKVQEAVSYNELYFSEAIDALKRRLDNLYKTFQDDASTHQISIKEGYEAIYESIKEVSINQIEEYRKLYENAPPQFKELEKLEYLVKIETINQQIEELHNIDSQQHISLEKISQSQNSILEFHKSIESKMEELSSRSKINDIVSELQEIKKEVRKKVSKPRRTKNQESDSEKEPQNQFWWQRLNPFKNGE